VYLWDLQTKAIAQTLVGHTGAVLAVSAHPTEMIVASGGMAPDNTVKIWKDLSTADGDAAGSSDGGSSAAKESDSATSGIAVAQ
jgi:WD40 repeat protein